MCKIYLTNKRLHWKVIKHSLLSISSVVLQNCEERERWGLYVLYFFKIVKREREVGALCCFAPGMDWWRLERCLAKVSPKSRCKPDWWLTGHRLSSSFKRVMSREPHSLAHLLFKRETGRKENARTVVAHAHEDHRKHQLSFLPLFGSTHSCTHADHSFVSLTTQCFFSLAWPKVATTRASSPPVFFTPLLLFFTPPRWLGKISEITTIIQKKKKSPTRNLQRSSVDYEAPLFIRGSNAMINFTFYLQPLPIKNIPWRIHNIFLCEDANI